ncbi:MAG: adenylate kinase [archaeon]|nr:adenylate kinase [archaeon]
MNLVLLGPPGTGKGTISKFIETRFKCTHISTGDLLRNEVARKTEIGLKVEPMMKDGKLVSDFIVLDVLKKRLNELNGHFILDGFPRNLAQGKILDSLLKELNISLDAVIEIDSPSEVIVKRLSSRRQCVDCKRIYGLDVPSEKMGVCDDCGGKTILREDDNSEIVAKRINLYNKITKPLSDFYAEKGLLVKVDGNRTLQEIFPEVEKTLKKFGGD